MKHQHDACEHQLRYCKTCDVVYCVKCEKEWKFWSYVWTYPASTGTVTNPSPYKVTYTNYQYTDDTHTNVETRYGTNYVAGNNGNLPHSSCSS